MYIEKKKISKKEIKKLSTIITISIIIIFIILFFSFWNIQILKNHYYNALATSNIMKNIEIKAPRGFILDRNHKRMSENKLSFNLSLIREYVKDMQKTIANTMNFTGMDQTEIKKSIEKFKDFPASHSIPLKKNLSLEQIVFIESRSDKFPEFEINIEPSRTYPYQTIASHILGYISELNADELRVKSKEGYKLGDIIGKSGIEKIYEKNLRGINGTRTVVKDNLGKIYGIIKEKKPEIGCSVVLTIDIKLQNYIEQVFSEYKGTVSVIDLKTGGILALVSKPNFNPEFFSDPMDTEKWQALVNNPDNPLHNKFIQGLYSPGSVFKIVMALAGLEEELIDANTITTCYGRVKIYDRFFHCSNRSGHGKMNIYNALKHSCNVFFYQLGKRLDIDIIEKYSKFLGLGEETLIDLPNEKKGLIPSKAWKLSHLKEKWYPGETISVAIGGGLINVTPAQVLTMISTVALRGKMPKLHLLKQIEGNGKILKEFDPEFKEVPIKKSSFETVIDGLFKVVNEGGTGGATKIAGLNICGKTGTHLILSLENPNYNELVKQKKYWPHAWFASFAPRENPEVAMVVFVENGGDAARVAVPLAAKIYRKIFE